MWITDIIHFILYGTGMKYVDKGWWEYPIIGGVKSWFYGEKISHRIRNKIKIEIENLKQEIKSL